LRRFFGLMDKYSEKILRVLEVPFDSVEVIENDYAFMLDGIIFARIGISKFSTKQRSVFNSLRKFDIQKNDRIN